MKFRDEVAVLFGKYRQPTGREFNIFRALHNPTSEKNLHSRFLSYLLSPLSTHGQGTRFIKTFLTNIGISGFSFEGLEVRPNEFDKREYNDIDILITNHEKQAIIIENKIFAPDSNRKLDDGTELPQMIKYFDKIRSEFEFESDEEAKSKITLLYLTPYRRNPSLIDTFKILGIEPITVDYIQFVTSWLKSEINELEDGMLKDALIQYWRLLIELTNDIVLALELKHIMSANIEEAWLFNQNYEMDKIGMLYVNQLKHVKWHTVHEFWRELSYDLQQIDGLVIQSMPTDKDITKLTHGKRRQSLVCCFDYRNSAYYIANDEKGFTYGKVEMPDSFKKFDCLIFNPDFNNFDSEKSVFLLINADQRTILIRKLVCEIGQQLSRNPS
ncbi:PD-(D/E)XK nuclease family protein [Sphingobacterium oryzagri]|uniref:PD-(D/E)XK nuclease family protein n=1 Tax=Sphingobacterium oryzagri TaxID=3025669 RepID=A0ABY7WMS3_9SPHI|nr:PD-(D/E)XK nuclease family protein [Sphingobacterium sp. KACC 22765]WDF69716.1 PD-(D/E)XK nuclease family protein [Sphingobacterium sp. KACC 22765]